MKDIVEEYNTIWSLPKQKYLDLRVGSFVNIKVENAYIQGTITCNGFQLDQKTWKVLGVLTSRVHITYQLK